MPTYEYICAKCGRHFDFSQSISAAPLKVCPKDLCPKKPWGKGKVHRGVGGGAGLLFKGSGFYITDYRSEKYKAAAKKEAGAGSAADTGKKDSKTPSAPAAPAPPKKD